MVRYACGASVFRYEEQVKSGGDDGAYRDRTGDLRLAKPALSQLS
jgi:hypothetical protein